MADAIRNKGLTYYPQDLDINIPGFNWTWAATHGSHSLVIWSSTNLVDWSEPQLTKYVSLISHV